MKKKHADMHTRHLSGTGHSKYILQLTLTGGEVRP